MVHFSISDALEELKGIDSPFKMIFQHGSMELEMYKPDKVDMQTPHTRDELYIIAEGSGRFVHNTKSVNVSKGDFLFVPAGDEHRFLDFTHDFCTWVVFYGPEGGED